MINKKAQIFTMIAIVLIILVFTSYSTYTLIQDRTPIRTRVSSMNNFLSSVEKDLQRQTYIFGFRSLLAAQEYITTKHVPITNLTGFFTEAYYQGTALGMQSELLSDINHTIILQEINENAKKMNAEVNITNVNISLNQEDPWHIVFIFSANLSVKDKSGLVSWEKRENIKSYVSIENFNDPLYIISTNTLVVSRINKTIYEGLYTDMNNNIQNLSSHVHNGYYAENPIAPSFLNRLQGLSTANVNGIERLVDVSDIPTESLQGPISMVDYIYFSGSDVTPKYRVTGINLIIDQGHYAKYNCTASLCPLI